MSIADVRKKLMSVVITALTLTLAIVILYESSIILEGGFASNINTQFLMVTIMELLTICAIPVALRMFKFQRVKDIVCEKNEAGFYQMALLRMSIILLLLLINLMCYYLFMNVAFGYMAIILLISLVFVFPTKNRCEVEYENIVNPED